MCLDCYISLQKFQMCVVMYVCSLPFTLSAGLHSPPQESRLTLWLSPVVPSNLSHLPLTDLFPKLNSYHVSTPHPTPNSSLAPQCLLSYIYNIYSGIHGPPQCDANLVFHFCLPPVPLQIDRALFLLFFPLPGPSNFCMIPILLLSWILSPSIEMPSAFQ